MSMFVRYIFLLLIVGISGGSAQQVATLPPTSAPSSSPTVEAAPTSSPTSLVDDEPEDENKTVDSTTVAVTTSAPDETTTTTSANATTQEVATSTVADGGAENTSTSAAGETKPVTSFTTKLMLSDANDFSQKHYVDSIANATGVLAGNVVVKSVKFVVAATYKFMEDVTLEEIVEAVAAAAGLEKSAVNATIRPVRRLSLGRRLAVTAEVKIHTDDPETANAVALVARKPNDIAAKFSKAVTPPEIITPPSLSVLVETEVVSATDAAVAAPAGEKVGEHMSALTGKEIEAEIMDVVITGAPAITTKAAGGDVSGACYKSALTSLAVVFAMSMVAA